MQIAKNADFALLPPTNCGHTTWDNTNVVLRGGLSSPNTGIYYL